MSWWSLDTLEYCHQIAWCLGFSSVFEWKKRTNLKPFFSHTLWFLFCCFVFKKMGYVILQTKKVSFILLNSEALGLETLAPLCSSSPFQHSSLSYLHSPCPVLWGKLLKHFAVIPLPHFHCRILMTWTLSPVWNLKRGFSGGNPVLGAAPSCLPRFQNKHDCNHRDGNWETSSLCACSSSLNMHSHWPAANLLGLCL